MHDIIKISGTIHSLTLMAFISHAVRAQLSGTMNPMTLFVENAPSRKTNVTHPSTTTIFTASHWLPQNPRDCFTPNARLSVISNGMKTLATDQIRTTVETTWAFPKPWEIARRLLITKSRSDRPVGGAGALVKGRYCARTS